MQILILVGHSSPSVLTVSQIIQDVCQHPSISLCCKPLPEAERGYVFIRARESTQSKLNSLQAAKKLLMCQGKRSKQSFCMCCFHCSLFRALFSLS